MTVSCKRCQLLLGLLIYFDIASVLFTNQNRGKCQTV